MIFELKVKAHFCFAAFFSLSKRPVEPEEQFKKNAWDVKERKRQVVILECSWLLNSNNRIPFFRFLAVWLEKQSITAALFAHVILNENENNWAE